MTEKNRDILKNALHDLPAKKAGKSNWEHISAELDQAGASQFMSDNLAKLPRYKAPAGAWKSIEKALPFSFSSFFSNSFVKVGAGVFTLAALLTSFYFLTPAEESEKDTIKQEEIQSAELSADEPTKARSLISDEISEAEPEVEQKQKTESSHDQKSKLTGSSKFFDPSKTSQKLIIEESIAEAEQISDASVSERQSLYVFSMLAKDTDLVFGFENKSEISPKNFSAPLFYSDDYYRKRNQLDLSLGAFYSHISFQDVSVQNMEVPESISSFGLDLMLENRKFFLKTGISYLSWEEKAKYTFAYRQNELVYSYNYVDSAYIQPGNGDIHYYTSRREVFDSVSHQKADEILYEYRVLQIPLKLGYKIVDNQHFMFGLNAGVGADFRIGGREIRPVFSQDEARITAEVNYLDYRFKLNWRFTGGLSLYYRISDRFRFYFEPSYHQYLNSVYKNAGLKNVSYIELKTGIIYKF